MRAVLYSDDDFEPITVIDVPNWLMQKIRVGEHVRIEIIEPPNYVAFNSMVPEMISIRSVYIFGEPVIRKNVTSWFLFTKDEELAMLLKNTYLPGQVGDIAKRRKEAFVEGLVTAFKFIGE